MTAAFRAGANNSGNTAAPSVVVPAGCAPGDVILVHFSQNNTDVQTAAPAGLTQIDLTAPSASFPNRLYWGVVGVGGITAGGTLSWTLSATRQWAVSLYAASGIDNTTPIQGTPGIAGVVATTSTTTAPSLTTTASSWLVECVSSKSNGTTIASFTAPSGWTVRATAGAAGTFGGASSFADRNAGTAASGTYGSDAYTSSAAGGAEVGYTIALNPAGNYSGGATTQAVTATGTATGGGAGSTSTAASTTGTAAGVVGKTTTTSMATSFAPTATGSVTSGLTGAASLAATATASAGGTLGVGKAASLAATAIASATGSVATVISYTGSASLDLSVLATPIGGGIVQPISRPFIYLPPTWRTVVPMAGGGALRVSFETSTCVYRRGGVWHNVMVASEADVSDIDVWVNPANGSDTLTLFFVGPTPIPAELQDELGLVPQADASWTPAQILLTGYIPLPIAPSVTYVDNGDGTFTASGTAVIDNGDGTFTVPATDNGDGTWSP